jgi:hypothetical protein
MLYRVLGWIRRQIVEEVPEDIAICEFGCHKSQCTMQEWLTCHRRLGRAAGEFLPADSLRRVA